MTDLAHATLQRLAYAHRATEDKPAVVRVDGDAVEVQFNPATLKISRKNNVDRGGVTTKTQKRQHPSQEGSTLAFDLEFDTAEQGEVGARVNVRDWTALIRQFVEPRSTKPGAPPPAVRFRWGSLAFDGLIDQFTEDLEHFAPDGTPLRAKVGVSIAEQNFDYESRKDGPGAKTADAATPPGRAPTGAAPGSRGTGRPEQVVRAVEGESVAQLLTRLGLEPEAWRAAMSGLDSPLPLPAGTPVQLGAEVRAAGGIGASAGFAAGPAAVSADALAAALGGSPGASSASSASASTAAGFTLSAAGGAAAAAATVEAAVAASAVVDARAGFSVPAAGADVVASGRVDARAVGYGRGVPLAVRANAATAAEVAAGGRRSVAARARRGEAAPTRGAGAPWERLPP